MGYIKRFYSLPNTKTLGGEILYPFEVFLMSFAFLIPKQNNKITGECVFVPLCSVFEVF